MLEMSSNIAIIGGGIAGIITALEFHDSGVDRIVVIEHEDSLGGMLKYLQRRRIKDETGEVSARDYLSQKLNALSESSVIVLKETTVVNVERDNRVVAISPRGVVKIKSQKVILATGARFMTREELIIPGYRPAGIFTAFTALSLLNEYRDNIGKVAIIQGTHDITLEAAIKFLEKGGEIKAILENEKDVRTCDKNLVEILAEKGVKIITNAKIIWISGDKRVNNVIYLKDNEKEQVACDTVIIGTSLVPRYELPLKLGVKFDFEKKKFHINGIGRTNLDSVYLCGHLAYPSSSFEEVIKMGKVLVKHILTE